SSGFSLFRHDDESSEDDDENQDREENENIDESTDQDDDSENESPVNMISSTHKQFNPKNKSVESQSIVPGMSESAPLFFFHFGDKSLEKRSHYRELKTFMRTESMQVLQATLSYLRQIHTKIKYL
ncbi:9648_t:CDS:2, partial [Paraglomus occultum]